MKNNDWKAALLAIAAIFCAITAAVEFARDGLTRQGLLVAFFALLAGAAWRKRSQPRTRSA